MPTRSTSGKICFTAGLVVRSLSGEPSVNLDGLLTLPMHRTLSMLASLSITLLVSFIFKELFARGEIKDYLQCFVVIGQDNSGRLLVQTGLHLISPPVMEPVPERPGLVDGPEADTGANTHTPICLPEAVTEECEVPKPDDPELQLSTAMRRSSTQEYQNYVNQSRSSKSPTTRTPKVEGNDDNGGGTPKKASKASTPIHKKASPSSVDRKSTRSSRSTTPRSKSPRKRGSKSGQASLEHECEVPKPDAPELQLSTTLRRSSTEEYRNDVNQSRSSKSPTTRPPKIEGNDDIGGGTPNKASQASTPVRKKASTSSVGRKSARSSRSTTPRSKSPRKRGSKSCQASVEQSP